MISNFFLIYLGKKIAHIQGTEVDQEKEKSTKEKEGVSTVRKRVTRVEIVQTRDTQKDIEDQDHQAMIVETEGEAEGIEIVHMTPDIEVIQGIGNIEVENNLLLIVTTAKMKKDQDHLKDAEEITLLMIEEVTDQDHSQIAEEKTEDTAEKVQVIENTVAETEVKKDIKRGLLKAETMEKLDQDPDQLTQKRLLRKTKRK